MEVIMMQKKKVHVGTGFVLMLSVFYFFDDSGIFGALICSVLVHELGHFLAIKVLGENISRLELELTGAAIFYDNSRVSYFSEALIAAMGPIFGLVFSVITASLARANEGFLVYSGVSFCLSVLNLLPAQNLDGGRILSSILSRLKDEIFAERFVCITSCFVSFILLVLGSYIMLVTNGNFTFLLVGLWVLFDFIRVTMRRFN